MSETQNEIRGIRSGSNLIAVIVPHTFHSEKNVFVTSDQSALQVGYIRGEKGGVVPRHMHPRFERIISETMECLFLKDGLLNVELYDAGQCLVGEYQMTGGDLILFVSGGHRITYLENSALFEVRQGPYDSQRDKAFF